MLSDQDISTGSLSIYTILLSNKSKFIVWSSLYKYFCIRM